jgi:hypothetical protein
LDGWPVHVVLYPPEHFLAVAGNEDLLFVFLREVRKLLEGEVLFDIDGTLARTLERLREVQVPRRHLQPLAARVMEYHSEPGEDGPARLSFYHALETLAYVWMHLDLRYRYTKPKWLIDDARRVESRSLVGLLEEVSQELTEVHDVNRLVGELAGHLSRAGEGRMQKFSRDQLGDAKSLLAGGRYEEAVWPLRMAVYMLAQLWAEAHDVSYLDLRSIAPILEAMERADAALAASLKDVLLYEKPLPPSLASRLEEARAEFLAHWWAATPAVNPGALPDS